MSVIRHRGSRELVGSRRLRGGLQLSRLRNTSVHVAEIRYDRTHTKTRMRVGKSKDYRLQRWGQRRHMTRRASLADRPELHHRPPLETQLLLCETCPILLDRAARASSQGSRRCSTVAWGRPCGQWRQTRGYYLVHMR